MFQSVMNPVERRNLGAHYTSETNILKLIKPLFLDDLWREFESIKDNRNKLQEFHQRLSRLKFLDPACGCGNFLVITYRELRLLEIEILRSLRRSGEQFLNVGDIIWLNVDQFYGIEYEEFPAHRRGRHVAHRPPDEHGRKQRVWPVFRAFAVEKIGDDRPRQCVAELIGQK